MDGGGMGFSSAITAGTPLVPVGGEGGIGGDGSG